MLGQNIKAKLGLLKQVKTELSGHVLDDLREQVEARQALDFLVEHHNVAWEWIDHKSLEDNCLQRNNALG